MSMQDSLRTWNVPLEVRMQARFAENTRRLLSKRARAEAQIARVSLDRGAEPIDAYMPDSAIRALAEKRAELMAERIGAIDWQATPPQLLAWLNGQVQPLGGRPLVLPKDAGPDALRGLLRRAQCRLWWRRCLRRAVVQMREETATSAGEVCARMRQIYVTDDTARRRVESEARNRKMLEQTELESADGEVINLAAAVDASVSNKAIRRGELMTRIRGCEELAEAAGMVGIFTTNTAPSRFHHVLKAGGRNPRADGTDGPMQPNAPRDAQRWLCSTWAKARSALHRAGVAVFGFRVAEPHHDGCPHWHMLLWCPPAQLNTLRDTMRRYWLADHGDEPGAQEHRFKAVQMEKGGATGYCAKYVAKNIDDAGAVGREGHLDEYGGERIELGATPAQAELWQHKAKRVEAWASAHGIRQFQAVGQPPVTVWRELRRIAPEGVAGATDAIQAAHAAAHRVAGRLACWRAYMQAQGGAAIGRHYRIRIAERVTEVQGRYETAEVSRPIGVYDARRPEEWCLSDRRTWKPKGTWSAADRTDQERAVLTQRPQAVASPWTRFNNCSRAGGPQRLLAQIKAREPGAASGELDHEHHQHQHHHPPDPGSHPDRHHGIARRSPQELRACFAEERGRAAS